MWWKTIGQANKVVTSVNPGGSTYERNVEEDFKWGTWPSLAEVDAPRTPANQGTYEHEIRFFPDGNNRRWCDPSHNAHNVITNMPNGYYRDTVSVDANEFTWGMPTAPLDQTVVYFISFDCNRTTAGQSSSNVYNLTGQLGHCHVVTGCTSVNTFADESNRLIPQIQGRAPETQQELGYFGNYTFDSGISPWTSINATLTQITNNPNPYHGCCYAFLDSNSGQQGQAVFAHTPNPPSAGTAAVYLEAVMRCPSAWNSSYCPVRFIINGYDVGGSLTQQYLGSFVNLPNDDNWYVITPMQTDAFPSGTTNWKFIIQVGAGYSLDVDYNQEWWLRPS